MATNTEIIEALAKVERPGGFRLDPGPTIAVDDKDGIAAATLLSLGDLLPQGATNQDFVEIVNKMQFWLHFVIARPREEGEGAEEPGL